MALPGGDGPWIGVVQTVGAPRAGTRPATMLVEVEGGGPVRIAATLPWFPAVVPGDRVEVAGRIRPPPADEYGEYLAKIGAIGTLTLMPSKTLPGAGTLERTLEGFDGPRPTASTDRCPSPRPGSPPI